MSVSCVGFRNGGSSSVGRALDCGSEGRGFESRLSPHFQFENIKYE